MFIVLLILLAASWLGWRILTEPHADADHVSFEKLQRGMSRAEVEAVLGLPHDYFAGLGNPTRAVIKGKAHVIHCVFDDEDTLLAKVLHFNEPFDLRVRRWLHLP